MCVQINAPKKLKTKISCSVSCRKTAFLVHKFCMYSWLIRGIVESFGVHLMILSFFVSSLIWPPPQLLNTYSLYFVETWSHYVWKEVKVFSFLRSCYTYSSVVNWCFIPNECRKFLQSYEKMLEKILPLVLKAPIFVSLQRLNFNAFNCSYAPSIRVNAKKCLVLFLWFIAWDSSINVFFKFRTFSENYFIYSFINNTVGN